MSEKCEGKVALVTGASRGLGRAIALALGKAGAYVAVTDLLIEGETHDKEALKKYSALAGHFSGTGEVKTRATASEIQAMGSRSCALKMDVADGDEVTRVVRTVEDELGPVDILVNNAGVVGERFFVFQSDDAVWRRTIELNLFGTYYCTKAFLPQIIEHRKGRIINIASISGKQASPTNSA